MIRSPLLRLLVCVLVAKSTALYAAEKPNILFIVCDDLNTHVSPSGYSSIQTPTLAALSESGMTFENAYCQYPVCGPSRASFLHGLYPESTGVLNNTADIRETRPGTTSMPEFFKKSGYWTGSVGKVFHSTRHEHGEVAWDEHLRFDNDELPVVEKAKREFEAVNGSVELGRNKREWKTLSKKDAAPLNAQTPPGHGRSGLLDHQHKDGKNVRQVKKWLEEKTFGESPFFIALGIQKPHVPFLAPDKYFDQYPRKDLQFELVPSNLWDVIPRDAMSPRYKAFGFELGIEKDKLRREYIQAYHACISFIDAQLALVIESLKQEKLWENTIVVFTSDHGYHLGEHFLWGKVTLFDIGTRVPFIVRVPGMTQPGSRSSEMVELVDVFPTLAELADLEPPPHLQGVSLVPQLESIEKVNEDKYAYTVVSRRDSLGRAIRNVRWRYTQWPGGEELYDLESDPGEIRNLAKKEAYSAKLESLRAVLSRKQKAAALGPKPN